MFTNEPDQFLGFEVQVFPCFCYMFSPGEAFVEMEAEIFNCFCLWYDSLVDIYWWAGFLP
jgi:hypothetical protein